MLAQVLLKTDVLRLFKIEAAQFWSAASSWGEEEVQEWISSLGGVPCAEPGAGLDDPCESLLTRDIL